MWGLKAGDGVGRLIWGQRAKFVENFVCSFREFNFAEFQMSNCLESGRTSDEYEKISLIHNYWLLSCINNNNFLFQARYKLFCTFAIIVELMEMRLIDTQPLTGDIPQFWCWLPVRVSSHLYNACQLRPSLLTI